MIVAHERYSWGALTIIRIRRQIAEMCAAIVLGEVTDARSATLDHCDLDELRYALHLALSSAKRLAVKPRRPRKAS